MQPVALELKQTFAREAAVAEESRSAVARASVQGVDLALYDNLEAVKTAWRAFEQKADCTAFQTFEWLSTWQRHIGARNAVTPCVVLARGATGVLFMLPLAIRPAGFTRELTWLGADLCDYNAPLLAPEFSEHFDATAFRALWHDALQLAQSIPQLRFDLVRLERMPRSLRDQNNPMLALPTALHPSGSYAAPLAGTWEAFYAAKRSGTTRRRDRSKRKRLAELGSIELATAENAESALAALAVLVEQKSQAFARRGIPNLFARPGYLDFFKDFVGSAPARSLAHISELRVGRQTAAANFALTFGGRYYYVLSSYTDGEMSRFGPGAVHLHEIMRYAIDNRFTMFDFTIGDEQYKLDWCEGVEPLYDHVSTVNWRGALIAAPALSAKRLKRKIKQTPLLWAMFRKARALAAALAQARFAKARSAPLG
jgi:CelD/BcsL family acetyltransferase involved in cellulose biosynthesis